ncbi:MAG: hypothetical protein J7L55_02470 [Desulfurococcales archaeon]|nr:hypothetical protein [Desulfurococcales archaeon]
MFTQLFMLVVYVALLSFAAFLAMKYGKIEVLHQRKHALNVRSAMTRIYLMGKLSALILRKPFTGIILLTIGLSALIAAFSASSTSSVTDVTKTFGGGGNGNAFFVEFSNPSQVNTSQICSSLHLSEDSCIAIPLLRVSLSEPLKTNVSKSPLYVLVGVEDKYYGLLTGQMLPLYSAPPHEGVAYVEIMGLGVHDVVEAKLVNESCVRALRIYRGIPLLPIEGFIGSKPVLPPPKYVFIAPLSQVSKLLGGAAGVTDLLVLVEGGIPDLHVLLNVYEDLSKEYSVKDLWVFSDGQVLILSSAQIPTPSSVVASLIAASIAVLLSTSLFSAAMPYLRSIYWRLILEGFPPWAMNVVMLFYVSVVVWSIGVSVVAGSLRFLGSASAFNALIMSAVVWVSLVVYSSRIFKLPSLRNDVYIPPTERYTLLTPIKDIKRVKNLVEDSLRGNEFFTMQGLESAEVGEEVVIHARLSYKESWGSGLDVSAVLTPEEDATLITITAITWGIEEVSEAVTRNMLGLALSRIAGVIKSWE